MRFGIICLQCQSKGDISYGDMLKVFPYSNELCVIKASGQQILDVLEWGAKSLPGEPIDPEKLYTVGGIEYTLLRQGDGITAFDGCEVVADKIKLDVQAMTDYICDDLGGEIGEDYADMYGQGRITIKE